MAKGDPKETLCDGVTASRPFRECSLTASYSHDGKIYCKHHAPKGAKKMPRKRKRAVDNTKAPTIDQAKVEQRVASFSAMTPAEKFDAFEARGYTIERQRTTMAKMQAELSLYTLRHAKTLSDGTCIVCGAESPLEPLCSDKCAALHGRSAADWRP